MRKLSESLSKRENGNRIIGIGWRVPPVENRLSLRVNIGRYRAERPCHWVANLFHLDHWPGYFTIYLRRGGTATLVRPKKYWDPVSRLVHADLEPWNACVTICGHTRAESRGPLSTGPCWLFTPNNLPPRLDSRFQPFRTFKISKKSTREISVTGTE